ncbi:MAG: hypothetical protein ACJ71K_21880 [Nitrososphaeraceae archaeon]|jgi:hypothetical protein
MNKTRQIMSIVAVIAAATILALPGILSSPVLGSLGQSSTSNDGTSSSSARNDYKNFQNCLSDAEGTKGYATEKEVGDCFNPIYNTGTSGSGGSSGSSSDNDNSDSNSPRS